MAGSAPGPDSGQRLGVAGPILGVLALAVPVLHWRFLVSGSRDAAYYGAYALIAGCLMVSMVAGRLRDLRGWSLAGLLGALGLATLLSPLPEGGAFGLQSKALLLAATWLSVFWTAQLVTRGRHGRRTLSWALGIAGLVYSGAIYAAFALYRLGGLHFGEIQTDAAGRIRVFGPAGDQASYVVAYALVRSAALGQPLGVVLHAGALLLTGTRGAVLCALVGLLAVGILRRRHGLTTKWSFARWAGATVLIAAAFVWLLGPLAGTLVSRSASIEAWAGTAIGRLGSLQLGWLVFGDRPLVGFGFNGFRDAIWTHDPSAFFVRAADPLTALAANQTTQIAADGGLLALAALAWLFGFLLWASSRPAKVGASETDRRHLMGLQAIVVAAVIGNQFSVYLDANASAGYFLMLAAGGVVSAAGSGLARGRRAASRRGEAEPEA